MVSKQPGLFFLTITVLFVVLALASLYQSGALDRLIWYLATNGRPEEVSVSAKSLERGELGVGEYIKSGALPGASSKEVKIFAETAEKEAAGGPILIRAGCQTSPSAVRVLLGDRLLAKNADSVVHKISIEGQITVVPSSKDVNIFSVIPVVPGGYSYYCDGERSGVILVFPK